MVSTRGCTSPPGLILSGLSIAAVNEGCELLSAPSLLALPAEAAVGRVPPTHSPRHVWMLAGGCFWLWGNKEGTGCGERSARRLHGVLPSPPPVPAVPTPCPGHRGSVPWRGCRRGFASEGLGQAGARGERTWLRQSVLPQGCAQARPAQLVPAPGASGAPVPPRCPRPTALPARGSRVPVPSRPGRPAPPHRRAAKIMNKLLLINTL